MSILPREPTARCFSHWRQVSPETWGLRWHRDSRAGANSGTGSEQAAAFIRER